MYQSSMDVSQIKYSCFLWLLLSLPVAALEFNTKELVILKGKDPELSAEEGYLYLSFQTNTDISDLIIDHVESGKKLKFKTVNRGDNHLLIKLKAGTYYWKSLKKKLGLLSYRFKFEKDTYQFEVKPGVVNYPGSWMFNLEWHENGGAMGAITTSNKMAYEWLHYNNHYAPLIDTRPIHYQGIVQDNYLTQIQFLLSKYPQTDLTKLNYHGLETGAGPIKYVDTTAGVESQNQAFPNLQKYVKNNDSMVGELSPNGDFVLLHRVEGGYFLIEILHTITFKSYVILREQFRQNTRVRNLSWIDDNSFLYDLKYNSISSTHVVHLKTDASGGLTGARQYEFPIDGEVIDTLLGEEDTLLFANFTDQESVRNDGRGLYKVITTNSDTISKSFWKTVKHTRQFDYVIQWLTDNTGEVRSAIELEYDKKQELFLYHHWFLSKTAQSAEWVKIKTTTSDEDIPAPIMLSADESFFYAITNKYSEMKSIHKYSTEDYAYLGPFYEDKSHDILGMKSDPTTKAVTAYSYAENGTIKLNFFDAADDRIKALRDDNPDMSLFVRQYNKKTGQILIFGTTNYSKGAWYLYNEHSKQVTKLMDINADYEALPKGDTHVVQVQAADGVTIEGYLVKPNSSNPPLVVIPHGGPIGVRDYADNDEMQHFFASHGVATLKVNYRGSSGFGKAFESMGNGQWGEKIEADIHQLVMHATEKHQLNRDQICAMGGSYGGYSAMMLTLLYPDTYQCAVSFAGVVDLPLLFTGITASTDEEYISTMKKIVGDPDQDYQKLLAKSPFYLAERITKPIKLFHGALDDVVSLEQAFRMQQAASILGLDSELTVIKNEAHSFQYVNTIIFYLAESLQFIQQQLGLEPTARPVTSEGQAPVIDFNEF